MSVELNAYSRSAGNAEVSVTIFRSVTGFSACISVWIEKLCSLLWVLVRHTLILNFLTVLKYSRQRESRDLVIISSVQDA